MTFKHKFGTNRTINPPKNSCECIFCSIPINSHCDVCTYSHFLGSEPLVLLKGCVPTGVKWNVGDHFVHFIQRVHFPVEGGNLQQPAQSKRQDSQTLAHNTQINKPRVLYGTRWTATKVHHSLHTVLPHYKMLWWHSRQKHQTLRAPIFMQPEAVKNSSLVYSHHCTDASYGFFNKHDYTQFRPTISGSPKYHLETENLQVLDGFFLAGKSVDKLFQCLDDGWQRIVFGFCLGFLLQLLIRQLVQELGDDFLTDKHLGNCFSQVKHVMLITFYLTIYCQWHVNAKDQWHADLTVFLSTALLTLSVLGKLYCQSQFLPRMVSKRPSKTETLTVKHRIHNGYTKSSRTSYII